MTAADRRRRWPPGCPVWMLGLLLTCSATACSRPLTEAQRELVAEAIAAGGRDDAASQLRSAAIYQQLREQGLTSPDLLLNQGNAYRRAALQSLQSATDIAEIAQLLKRTALCAFPRTDVTALSGDAWCRWLGETGGIPVPDHVAVALKRGVFDKADDASVGEVGAFAVKWIKHHRNPIVTG